MNNLKKSLILMCLLTFMSSNAVALGSKKPPPNPPFMEKVELLIGNLFK